MSLPHNYMTLTNPLSLVTEGLLLSNFCSKRDTSPLVIIVSLAFHHVTLINLYIFNYRQTAGATLSLTSCFKYFVITKLSKFYKKDKCSRSY